MPARVMNVPTRALDLHQEQIADLARLHALADLVGVGGHQQPMRNRQRQARRGRHRWARTRHLHPPRGCRPQGLLHQVPVRAGPARPRSQPGADGAQVDDPQTIPPGTARTSPHGHRRSSVREVRAKASRATGFTSATRHRPRSRYSSAARVPSSAAPGPAADEHMHDSAHSPGTSFTSAARPTPLASLSRSAARTMPV